MGSGSNPSRIVQFSSDGAIAPATLVFVCARAQSLTHVRLFATPWTAARQAPLSMGFSGQEYGVGCHFLFQRIFRSQESNLHLLHWQAGSLPLSHLGSHNGV